MCAMPRPSLRLHEEKAKLERVILMPQKFNPKPSKTQEEIRLDRGGAQSRTFAGVALGGRGRLACARVCPVDERDLSTMSWE